MYETKQSAPCEQREPNDGTGNTFSASDIRRIGREFFPESHGADVQREHDLERVSPEGWVS